MLQTVLFAAVTRIGLQFSYVGTGISQIWSPAGVSLIVLFFSGPRMLPAVFIGTAVNYLTILPSVPAALFLAAGSALEAWIGYRMLLAVKFLPSLNSLREIGKLVFIGGGVGTAVNALVSTVSYALFIPLSGPFSTYMVLWWLGNLVGVIVIAPILCLVISQRLKWWSSRRLAEFFGLIIVVGAVSYTVFNANFFSSVLNYSLAFMLFPFAIVASIRFGLVGSVLSTFVISLNATISTQTGLGLFAAESYASSILLVDVFLLVLGITSLALASLIEERSTAEQSVRSSEERYRIVTERTGHLVYDYNIETGIILWGGAVMDVSGYSPKEFEGMDFKRWLEQLHPDDREETQSRLLAAMRSHAEFRTEYRFRKKEGRYVEVLDRGAFLYRHPGDIVAYRMLGSMSDISVIKESLHRLQESEERYRLFSTLTSDYIYSAAVTANGIQTEWASDAFQRITGYTVSELNSNDSWDRIMHPDDIPATREAWQTVFSGKPVVVEYRVTVKNGEVRWLRDYVKPIIDQHTNAVIRIMGGVQDITERKRVEERFRSLIERSADGIILLNKRGIITFVSTSATTIIGYAPEELLQQSIFSILHPSEAKKYSFKFGRLSAEYDRSEYLLGRFRHKNGEWVHIEGMVTNLFNNPGVNAFVANFRNVTDRIEAEDRLRRSLQEKEILLKEVHHRVKNNMQVISSLLNLQSASLKDKSAVSMFRESQNRVKSMSLVHEILYQSQDLASVDFAVYAKQLVASLQKSFGAKTGEISVIVRVGAVSMDIDEAIPCGLIINELVSNALKYAFPKKRSGEIIVEMKKKRPASIVLSIRDTGVGMKKRSGPSSSLGLKLVTALTEQLKGTITIESKRGTSVTIEFPNHRLQRP
jgi:PAS domain S-box-containing protein